MNPPGSPSGRELKLPYYDRLQDSTKELFPNYLNAADIVSPTERLKGRRKPIAASALTIGPHNCDFVSEKLTEVFVDSYNATPTLNQFICGMIGKFEELTPNKSAIRKILECEAKIKTKYLSMGRNMTNEQEIRYVLADPIMEMICEIHNLEVRVT